MLGLLVAAGAVQAQQEPATPAEQYEAMANEFFDLTHFVALTAKSDDERNEGVARIVNLRLRLLDLAEGHSRDPIALDALVQVVKMEIWLENNTAYPGDGKDSPQVQAINRLLRDHVRSDRLGEACRMVHYGFHRECETFLRTVLEKNPHKEIQALACLRLAQFLIARSQRSDLVKEHPQIVRRYEGLFGKDYLEALQRQDRDETGEEIEAFFERAVERYGDVKLSAGTTVGEQAKLELYTIRHLSVGKQAPEIEGEDQDGNRFKLSDYRGNVVLLYFWSEFSPTRRANWPHGRSLIKKLEAKPFAMIGVNGNEFQAKRLKGIMEKEKLSWRSFVDQGDINAKWNVTDSPTYYVLDHKGVIRDKWVGRPGPSEKAIDAALEKLINEAERDANAPDSPLKFGN